MPNDIAQIAARFASKKEPISTQNAPSQTPSRKPFEPEMILIPAGEFLMGETLRQEYLPAYYIAKTPTTNIQYLAFVQAGGKCPEHWEGGKIPAGKELHPVVCVSWHDVMTYCDWLSYVTEKAYRLPTEQEWEKAARGIDGRKWPWGDEWQNGLCNSSESGIKGTTSVGRYSPQGDSPYGCTDMAGNVGEWTSSEHKGWKGSRVVRGGSWNRDRDFARCAFRGWGDPNHASIYHSIRCVSPIGAPTGRSFWFLSSVFLDSNRIFPPPLFHLSEFSA